MSTRGSGLRSLLTYIMQPSSTSVCSLSVQGASSAATQVAEQASTIMRLEQEVARKGDEVKQAQTELAAFKTRVVEPLIRGLNRRVTNLLPANEE